MSEQDRIKQLESEIERLRVELSDYEEVEEVNRSLVKRIDDLKAEIGQLRAALEKIATNKRDVTGAPEMIAEARRALKEKP